MCEIGKQFELTFFLELLLQDSGVGIYSNFGDGVGASWPTKDIVVIIEFCGVSLIVHHHLVKILLCQVWISQSPLDVRTWDQGQVSKM